MFTGIVETAGRIASIDRAEGLTTMWIDAGDLVVDARVGDSLSVNGACLTITGIDGERVSVQVVPETLSRTNLGAHRVGDGVNLERAMRADGRFDGHIVQGHVDGVGTVLEVAPEGDGFRMAIDLPPDLVRYVVEKGSIGVDGVSLTVAAIADGRCEIALIPHTMEATTLGTRGVGDSVNLEVDVLAKYVERLLGADRG